MTIKKRLNLLILALLLGATALAVSWVWRRNSFGIAENGEAALYRLSRDVKKGGHSDSVSADELFTFDWDLRYVGHTYASPFDRLATAHGVVGAWGVPVLAAAEMHQDGAGYAAFVVDGRVVAFVYLNQVRVENEAIVERARARFTLRKGEAWVLRSSSRMVRNIGQPSEARGRATWS